MKIKYVGTDGDGLEKGHAVQAFGHTFQKGHITEINDDHPEAEDIARRVKGNPHFEMAAKSAAEHHDEPKVKHQGAGKWSVVQGDEVLQDGLDGKQAAEAWLATHLAKQA